SHGLVEGPTDRRLFDTFQSAFNRYVATTARVTKLSDGGHGQAAANVLGDGPGDEQWDTLKALIKAWNNHKVATASAAANASRTSYDEGVTLIILMLAAAVAIAVIVAIIIARRTTRAVREVGAAANAISEGDIDQHVAVRSRDEFGQMAADFDAMI